MHIFLFGGTTEGRKIVSEIARNNEERTIAGMDRFSDTIKEKASENPAARDSFLAAAKKQQKRIPDFRKNPIFCDFLETDVYVATDYGAGLLPKEKHVHVHVGRLDAGEMFVLFRDAVLREEDKGSDASQVLVIDATHPYATAVTENIVDACSRAEVPCIRVYRPYGRLSSREMLERGSSDFLYFDTVKDAAAWLKTIYSSDVGIRKNIFIATGSKELEEYRVIPNFQDYCYVRALPTMDVLGKCSKLGFRRDRLILMQGPFKEDMNLAQMRYADAGFLVTKDSGEIGGFPEKCDAAIELGVRVLVIGRPKEALVPSEDWYQVVGLREVLGFISLL